MAKGSDDWQFGRTDLRISGGTLMRTVSLEELQALLGRTPAMVQMHPLSLAFLPDEVQVAFDDGGKD
jgi:hypothetical protein